MEVEAAGKSVTCELADQKAIHWLPHYNAGPKELNQIVNKFLTNEERLPYAFYISDEELLVQLGSYFERNKVSVEKVLRIVYQPQAVFRIRPVTRCSATISGHTEAVLSVSFSPDGRQLASGSGDTTVRLWDLNTQTPLFTCQGHEFLYKAAYSILLPQMLHGLPVRYFISEISASNTSYESASYLYNQNLLHLLLNKRKGTEIGFFLLHGPQMVSILLVEVRLENLSVGTFRLGSL